MSEDLDELREEVERMGQELRAAIEGARKATQRVAELEEQLDEVRDEKNEEIQRLQFRVAELEEEIEVPTEYDEMDRAQRVTHLQKELARRAATRTSGMYSFDYVDVKDTVFAGKPSDGYTFKLMRLAAGSNEDERGDFDAGEEGFAFQDPSSGNKRLSVNLDAVSDESVFHAMKNRGQGVAD